MDSVNLGSPTSTSHLVGPASGLASASNSSAGLGTGGGASKYSRLPNESDSPGHGGGNGTFGRAMQQQQQLVRDQVKILARDNLAFPSMQQSSDILTTVTVKAI